MSEMLCGWDEVKEMREIKFRCWCLDNNEWEKDLVLLSPNGGKYHATNSRGLMNIRPDRHIIMQYTGLKDKNGKEIYEGDIVECDDVISVIEFKDGKFQMITSEFQGQSPVYQERLNRFEVIGNIHENPELMEPINDN